MGKKYEGNKLESIGYNAIMSLVRMGDTAGDPWGTVQSHRFGLADTYYAMTGEAIPGSGYTNPPTSAENLEMLSNADEWPACQYAEMAREGQYAVDDIRRAFEILTRYRAWVVQAGRDY